MDSTDPGPWLSLTQIGEVRNLNKSNVSRALKRFADAGIEFETRPGPKNSKLLSLGAFDKAFAATADVRRKLAADRSAKPATGSTKVLAQEQVRQVAANADVAELRRDEMLRKLVPVADLARSAGKVAEAVVQGVEQLPGRVDELAGAFGRDGVSGMKAVLKTFVLDVRTTIARAMADLEGGARAQSMEES